MTRRAFDVTVVGAGVVGATLALSLARGGMRVAVVEAGRRARFDPDRTDLRVLAISPGSARLLDHLGVWDSIVAARVSPYREMEVWDAGGFGSIHFDSADIGEPALGHIVENSLITFSLQQALEQMPTASLLFESRPESLELTEEAAVLRLEDGRSLDAGLVVAADGRDSSLREMAGLDVRGWGYAQRAIVACIDTEKPHRETAWQRFMPEGPLAFLPLADGRCSIVWSTSVEQAATLSEMNEEAFCTALTEASDACLGRVTGVGTRAGFELKAQYAPSYIARRFALVGDAAHAVHPLAGQGANLGLMDASELATQVLEGREHGRDPGDRSLLRRYERARKPENLLMLGAFDAFKRGFGNSYAPLRFLRNAGLAISNRLGPVKHAFMRRAMGLGAELPPRNPQI
ncbi:MAG: UbiH/UbiF/VisC/COQ6 family ubiquinone biosynthesis hydroxylase [Gammaproteobacteria bacterium]|jgi:2-octaprenylphenol hydroxylase